MSRRERLEQLGNQPKKFTNVYVKNFGEEMTEADFKELVDSFGKVLSLKVVTSDQGRSKGFGFVSFETPEEAQKVSRQLLFTILSAFNATEETAILPGFHYGLGILQNDQLWGRFLPTWFDDSEEISFYIFIYRRMHLPVNARAKNMFSADVKRLCFRCQTLKFSRPNLSLRDLKRLYFRCQTLNFFRPNAKFSRQSKCSRCSLSS